MYFKLKCQAKHKIAFRNRVSNHSSAMPQFGLCILSREIQAWRNGKERENNERKRKGQDKLEITRSENQMGIWQH